MSPWPSLSSLSITILCLQDSFLTHPQTFIDVIHTHTHTLSLSFFLSFFLSFYLSLSLFLSFSLIPFSFSHYLSLSHTQTHTDIHTHIRIAITHSACTKICKGTVRVVTAQPCSEIAFRPCRRQSFFSKSTFLLSFALYLKIYLLIAIKVLSRNILFSCNSLLEIIKKKVFLNIGIFCG